MTVSIIQRTCQDSLIMNAPANFPRTDTAKSESEKSQIKLDPQSISCRFSDNNTDCNSRYPKKTLRGLLSSLRAHNL